MQIMNDMFKIHTNFKLSSQILRRAHNYLPFLIQGFWILENTQGGGPQDPLPYFGFFMPPSINVDPHIE